MGAISGGLADKEHKRPTDFSPDQLVKGLKVEKEHTPKLSKRLDITMDHLTENDKYYNDPMFKDDLEKKAGLEEAYYLGQEWALAKLEGN